MRAAPDVILIGEIRDRETMESAINLAGTGHLVLATLHANNAAETLDRVINMFPRDQHNQIFLDLSQYLQSDRRAAARVWQGWQASCCGRGDAQHAACVGARQQGRYDRGSRRPSAPSSERGVQSFDHALYEIVKQGRIELEEALNNADSRTNLEAKINFG